MPIIQVHNASPSSVAKKRELLAALTAVAQESVGGIGLGVPGRQNLRVGEQQVR
ncbi:hypothetical protein ACVWYS_003152 [Arthrobacter sp. TE12231]